MSSAPPKPTFFRWTFSLRTFLIVSLVLGIVLGSYGRKWLRDWQESQPPTLPELVQLAKRHGLPMPPPSAELVLARVSPEYDPWGQSYSPGFLLSEVNGDQLQVLQGCEQVPVNLRGDARGQGAWYKFSLDESPFYRVDWSSTAGLMCAIQVAERDEATAAKMLERIRQSPLHDCPLPTKDKGLPDLRLFVRYVAVQQLERRLTNEPDSWSEVRIKLAALIEESEELGKRKGQLLQDLAAALDAPPAKPGSVEALLLEASRHPVFYDHPSAQQLVERGFDAVPDLLRLLDDRRLTVHTTEDEFGGRNFRRVGELGETLLETISCTSRLGLVPRIEMPEDSDWPVADWDEWWREAKSKGEREYYIRNLIAGNELRGTPLHILQNKHPETLLNLGQEYQRIGPRKMSAQGFSLLIQHADNLPQKAEILARFAEQGSPDDRRSVLAVLYRLDRSRAIELLIKLLEEIPADADKFDFPSPDETFPYLVAESNDVRAGRVYLQAAKRNLSLRMELLSRVVHAYSSTKNDALRLALLAAFLDDESPRDRSPQYECFFRDTFDDISIRNYAASQIARMRPVGVQPFPDWTADQWAAFRAQVRERLQQEELPELE